MKIDSSTQFFIGRRLRLIEPKRASRLSDLIDVVQEVAALHQKDVVDVRAGGRLV